MIVGLGIGGPSQITPEAAACIRGAERLFYLAVDHVTDLWIRQLNPAAVSLQDLYATGKRRRRTYEEMTARLVSAVREGHRVCAAFYGHPGVFVRSSQWAIDELRKAGYPARMLPGISADACLYADLGVNPGERGVASFEATDFLLARRRFDPTSALILWQVGVLGESFTRDPALPCRTDRLETLVSRLQKYYPPEHRVVLYEAAAFAGKRAMARKVRLERLPRARISPLTTLYVPALPQRRVDTRILRWLDEES